MFALERDNDTICAVSTAPGVGGIAVIRVSGAKAWDVSKHLCPNLPNNPESHRVYYSIAKDPLSRDPIDEILVTFFAEGRSFTGESTVELSCHGGTQVSQELLMCLQGNGARLAEKGEFTYRAFMNGRIDLVQAESVLSLIESQNKRSARVAMRQLRGQLSDAVKEVIEVITWVMAHLEANIDFAAEDIEVATVELLSQRLHAGGNKVAELLATFKVGRILRDGLVVTLSGAPNVGKSSLLNFFVGFDRAIVTHVPGTTRDTVSEIAMVGGCRIEFTDTAGLRPTDDLVEKIGIDKAKTAAKECDVLLVMIDGVSPNWQSVGEAVENRGSSEVAVVVNKSDLLDVEFSGDLSSWLIRESSEAGFLELATYLAQIPQGRVFLVSAKHGSGLEPLKDWLASMGESQHTDSAPLLLQARHHELLQRVHAALNSGLTLLSEQSSPEFVLEELMVALRNLHELLGQRFDDQVLDLVFKEFCLGK